MQLFFSQNSLLLFNSYLHNKTMCGYPWQTIWFIYSRKRCTTGLNIGSSSLFSIFISDLPLVLSHSFVHLYADNTVICISIPHLTKIQNIFQTDLNALQEWLHSNNLLLNKDKSHTMVFGTKHMVKSKSVNLTILCNDGMYFHRVDQMKYFDLWLDPKLTFKIHIDYILKLI